jgi:succinate dehydrogenase/fumarate reductase flavoprotein subunit
MSSNDNLDADVIVIGFGGAGAAAAITAHDAGARVLIVEKMAETYAGGSTRVSGNVWFCPADPETALRYLKNLCGEYPIAQELMRVWADETARNTEWVTSLGAEVGLMEIPVEFAEVPGHECDDGFHHVGPAWGMGRLYNALKAAVDKRDIKVLYETRARELLRDAKTNAVVGLAADHGGTAIEIRARRAVVLASGGFANNAELVRTFLRLPEACPWGSPANTGDGLLMAQKAGAALANMHNYMGMMGLRPPGHTTGFNVVFPNNAWIIVDFGGNRFANETAQNKHGKILVGNRYILFPDRPCFAIFDETTRLAGPIYPTIEAQPYGWTQRIEDYRWSADNSAEIDKGWIVRAATVEELGARLGIDAKQLAATVAECNSGCEVRRDARHGRNPETMAPIRKPPYYAFAWGGLLVYTNGGPRKNERGQVLDAFGAAIPRLYAAGEVASTYSHCMAGGQMIADALAFGRIAGRNAAAETVSG